MLREVPLYAIIAYRTDEGTPWVLPVVRTVESQMSSDETLDHEYLAIDGLRSYTDAAARLLLGEDSAAITENRVCHHNDDGYYGLLIVLWSTDDIRYRSPATSN